MADTVDDVPGRFISDPDRGFRVWAIAEIYTGKDGVGSYCPNPDDIVMDYARGWLRVASVDYTTGLSTLIAWELPKSPVDISNEDVLLGVGPGYQSESWRVYLDTDKIPHILQIDGRNHVYGSAADYVKIFLGTDISVNGEVISAFYDQSGNFLGENIPLEVVKTADPNNVAIKTPLGGYTSYKLSDGEVVTVVTYSATGSVLSKGKMLIENTNLVRKSSADRRYVTGIRLESPFLSEADPMELQFPINVTASSVPLTGVVTYSNGDEDRYAIGMDDGSKFSLYGLRYYTPTIEGATVPLTLNYKLSEDEYSYISEKTYNGSITERYKARTTAEDNSYSVKLFMFPVWTGDVSGYTLDFWLYSLDRQEWWRVPKGKVEVPENSKNFDGLDFLSVQHLSVAVDLNAVDSKFNHYRHVQSFDIALKSAGDERRTNWTINFATGQAKMFGDDLEARMKFRDTNTWTVDISQDLNSKEEWLKVLYYGIDPLYNTRTEPYAPAPTHFQLVTARRSAEFSVELWNTDLAIYNDLAEGEVLFIRWIKRTVLTDMQLGVTGLPVHQIN